MKSLNYYQRKAQNDRPVCRCDENHWCNYCDPKRFPKPSGEQMIFTGNSVDYELAAKLAGLINSFE